MDYSLQNLNRIGKLDTLTFQDFIEKAGLPTAWTIMGD